MTNVRPATPDDLPALSALCQRSKAHWGYDAAFMTACREELTVTLDDLKRSAIMVTQTEGRLTGMVQLTLTGETADLSRLYVDPDAMGRGLGKALMDWAIRAAGDGGATRMTIEADPHARPFYEHLGARLVGEAPSGSIPDRMLPLLELELAG